MKKLIAVVLVLVMVLGALPAFASDNVAEDVLLKVKTKIDVPEDLTEFDYTTSTRDDVVRYNFTWHNEDYTKELYITSDTIGRIISYNYYEQTPYSEKRTLIGYTLADAQPLAEEIVKRFYGEYFTGGKDCLVLNSEKSTSRYFGKYKRFSFTFDRMYEGVEVKSNSVGVSVWANNENIYVQNVYASLDSNAEFSTERVSEISKDEYLENFPVRTYYAKDYETDKINLYYEIAGGFVSRATGKKITEQSFDRYAYKTQTSENWSDDDFEVMEESADGANGMITLSPEEKLALEEVEALVTAEEVVDKLRKYSVLKYTSDMKITYTNITKYDDRFTVHVTLESDKYNSSITYDGESGEVERIHSYRKYTGDKTEKLNGTDMEGVKYFVGDISGGKLKNTEENINYSGTSFTITYKRMINGIEYTSNRISVYYDSDEDMVTSFSMDWDDDIESAPDVSAAMGLDKAEDIIFATRPIHNVWVKNNDYYRAAITISDGITINAVTGEELYAQVDEKQAYTDIENHWAEDIINVLWEHDIYLAGGKFKPDEAITQADMIKLFSACRDGGIIPIGWEKDYIAEYGVTSGYIEAAEPDKLMTRKEAFEVLINILGYGEVAGFDIYKSSYADLEANGSAEILKAMGVLVGDTARPNDYLTHAEAAVMVYRYLSK